MKENKNKLTNEQKLEMLESFLEKKRSRNDFLLEANGQPYDLIGINPSASYMYCAYWLLDILRERQSISTH